MMKRSASALRSLLEIAVLALVAIPVSAQDNKPPVTIEGLVRDISCPIQNEKASATNFNLQCAVQCAQNGSPLIILSKDGLIYIPISTSMPDVDQRKRLLPFVGKYVKVTGDVFARTGTHAIAIRSITEMKNVHLTTNAQ
jgi:hypothetical protein